MKYETRNLLGLGGLILGGIIVCIAILFGDGPMLFVLLVVGLPLVLVGGYMMTRAFTEADTEHPDYQQYQDRLKQRDK